MASNSRSGGSKKGPAKGSGGKNRRSLRGKGPTPKAEDRVYHKAYRAAQNRKNQNASAQAKRKKREHGPNMVAGRNSVLEALREGVPATTMYVAGRIDSDDRVRESITLAAQRGISMLEASRPDLDRLTDDAIHQGIALQIPPYEYAAPSDLLEHAADRAETPLLVALDGITDPRNLGAIVRSTAAFGGHGVIIPERRAASMTAAAWKTSAGAASRIRVAQVVNLARAIDELKKQNVFVVGLDTAGEVDLPELTFSRDPLCIVVGSEGNGLSRLISEKCDQIVSIPIAASTESLNAGIAAAVSLYEVARSRRS